MRRFTSILFSPLTPTGNPAAVRRVEELARRHGATLTMYGVTPEPTLFQRGLHRTEHIEAVQRAERDAMAAVLSRCTPADTDVPVDTEIVSGSPALSIIERVLAFGHDLVVVTSNEDAEDHATIKRLLRKCPCPVWVIRPTRARTQRVLAAVNPDPTEAELNATILGVASSMVDAFGGELHVVHAWELYGESTMRSPGFLQVPTEEVDALVERERLSHEASLATVLAATGQDTSGWHLHVEKGLAAEVIGAVAAKNRINLLVIGTVARSGVAGLIMGNTAEGVLDEVRCSVIATKPPDFVSPVSRPG